MVWCAMVSRLFTLCTVHRGIFHSLLAALFFLPANHNDGLSPLCHGCICRLAYWELQVYWLPHPFGPG